MTKPHSPDQDQTGDDLSHESDGKAPAPEVNSPVLEHLQQTIDRARNAANAALSDQPDV